jgi:predicted enzyme related to lactoylglutathione lyase
MPSTDLSATKSFFSQLFGWPFQDYGPEYSSFHDGRIAGGFFASKTISNVAKGAPLVVFYSPDLEKMPGDVVRLGGKITREIFEFPGGRRFHFEAPGAGEFAIWSEK